MKPTHTHRCIATLAFFSVLACGFSADASSTATGNVTIDIVGMNTATGQRLSDEFLVPIEGGVFSAQQLVSSTALWNGAINNASGNADPFVNLAFGLTNVTLAPLEFTVSITVPIAPPIPGATLHGGSTGGSVTDSNFNGVGGMSTIVSVPGTPFYSGQIDGVGVLSIYPDPTSFPAGGIFAFPGQTVNIPALNPGLPGPTLPSGPALLTIGIAHHFLLAAGDSISTSSFFVVQPVPEPSSFVLALVGLVAVVYRVRRQFAV
jgi:hypothetical protein